MADQVVGVTNQPAGTGVKLVDTSEITVGSNTVERQRIVIADNTGAALFAGVNATGLKVDASGATVPVSIASAVPVTGTFYQATQPVSLSSLPALATGSNVIGKASLVDSGGTDATDTTNHALRVNVVAGSSSGAVAQGSTTSGQTGGLIQGAVTTSAPSYTTGQTDPLSLTTAGALRVDPSAVTSPVSLASLPALATGANVIGALTANQSVNVAQMNGVTTSMGIGASDTGTQRVALNNEFIQDQNITGATGQSTLNNNIILASAGSGATDCNGYRGIALQIITTAGITAGVISFEGSNDNTNFVAIALSDEATPTADPVTTITLVASTSRFMIGPIHFRYFRARISTAVTGGTVSAVTRLLQTAYSEDQITVVQSTASQLNVTVGASIPTGANTIGSVYVAAPAFTAGSLSASRLTGASAGTFAKASAGRFYGADVINLNAAVRYLHIYNKASAPTLSTDTPVVTIPIPASSRVSILNDIGVGCGTGVAWAFTTDAIAIPTTAGAAADIIGTIYYS